MQQARLKSRLAGGASAEISVQDDVAVSPPTVRAMQRSLEDLQAAGMRVDDIEAMLASGQHAVELDPALIDQSVINDRFDGGEANEEFCASITAHGQIVPILVRPLVGHSSHYQVVYGRRRLSAAKKLGIKVRAFIRTLTDDEALSLQAIENAQRQDLTFIERAVFAFSLNEMGFRRDSIGPVLNVSKSKLSEMISIPKDLGLDIVRAIGAAKEAGYRPWMKLARLAITNDAKAQVLALVKTDDFKAATSDDRLNAAIALFSATRSDHPDRLLPRGTRGVTIQRTATQTLITIDRRKSAGFANFIEENLPNLFAAYETKQPTTS
ncbi:MAG TPA: plasmid partitioning protein RepB [Methylocella sp.]|nr:plasmid partitioning protein RepB [Methylocella sp.]